MKTKHLFGILAAVSLLTVFSCTKEMDKPIDQPSEPETYTLSISASKGEFTKGLELSGDALNAIWDGTEEVYAFLNSDLTDYVAILTPDQNAHPDPAVCTLEGTFTTLPANGDVLTLKLTSNNYSGQDGTLDFIASYCDYAVATLNVTGVNNGQIVSSEGSANFENQQAIVKFTLKDKADDTTLLTPTTLTVNDGTSDIATATIPAATYSTNGDGVLYVAIPPVSGDLTITASDGTFNYKYTKTGASFTAGQYYNITVKMIKYTVDLSALSGDFVAQDGDILTGKLNGTYKLTIADGATVTLNGVTHNAGQYIRGIECLGSATIILAPGSVNDLTYGDDSAYCGIYCDSDSSTLTIEGTGTLNASGANYCSGIGGFGEIIINGGIITATGGSVGGAGIGSIANGLSGYNSITINGGDITAIGGSNGGAGIGTGRESKGGDITINGGIIKATGGMDAAGIGCGNNSRGVGQITITDGVTSLTTIKGGDDAFCIGLGVDSPGNNVITIDGKNFDPWSIDYEISSQSFEHFTLTISTTSINNDTWTFTHK